LWVISCAWESTWGAEDRGGIGVGNQDIFLGKKELGGDNVGPAETRVARCIRRNEDVIVRGNLSVFLFLFDKLVFAG
jgi:hypothetical protein